MDVCIHQVLPLIKAVNTNAAHSIKKNMDFQFTVVPVMDGASAVFISIEAGVVKEVEPPMQLNYP